MRGFSDNENGKNFYIFCRPYPANFHDSERPETKTNKQTKTNKTTQTKKRQQKYQLQQNPLKTFFLVILLMLKEQLSFAVHMNNIFN